MKNITAAASHSRDAHSTRRRILTTSIATLFRDAPWDRSSRRYRRLAMAVAATCGLALVCPSTPVHGFTYTGAIQVFDNTTNSSLGFLSATQNSYGEYGSFVSTAAAGLQVTFTIGSAPFTISLVTPNSASYPNFGAIQGFNSSSTDIGSGSANYLYSGDVATTAANAVPATGANSFTNATGFSEAIESTIWSLSGPTLVPQWVNSNSSKPTTIPVLAQSSVLTFTGDVTAFRNTFGSADMLTLSVVAAPATHWLGHTNGSWAGINWASNAAGTATAAVPTNSDDVTFSATGATHQGATTLGQDFTIHSLTVTDTTPVVISNGTGGTHTLTIAGNAGSGITVGNGANLTINSNVTLGNLSDTIEVDGSGQGVINGVLGGSHGLIKTGTGLLILNNNANSYTGNTTINGGTLYGGVNNAFVATSATTVNTGGTLELGTHNQTINSVSLAGGTIQDGNLTGAITSTGGNVNGVGGSTSLTTTSGFTFLFSTNNTYCYVTREVMGIV